LSQADPTDPGVGSVPDAAGPVTTTVTRRAKPGREPFYEPFYEPFLDGIIAVATRFPGHLGVEVFRPQNASTGDNRMVYRVDSGADLRAWLDSDEHAGNREHHTGADGQVS
jgi:uncharacterized protein